ncbi:MAG TPA: fasciclin domain-containing protein [Anaerolineae bacterium]|nr:fasciclin domain-containing protein [Anaerolineae bacterium]
MKYGSLIALLLVVVMVMGACAPMVATEQQPAATAAPQEAQPTVAPEPAAPAMDIVDTAVAAGSFNTLVAAVQAAGLEEALRSDGPFTVFAPTDDAFAAIPAEMLEALLADPETLSQILLFHVLPGKVMAESVADGLSVETLQGAPVTFAVMDGKATINDAAIVATDIEASNGVIHVIDAVILPPAEAAAEEPAMDIVDTAVAAGSFNTLVAAVQAAGLEEALRGEGPFTVFAPTDDAFAAIPAETLEALLADPEALSQILLYHVLDGKVMAADVTDGLSADTLQGSPVTFSVMDGTGMINDATIIATDIETSNGVIHVIDAVILPPAEGAAEEPVEPAASTMDIVDTADAAGSFTTLLAAIKAAGLEDALRGEGPLTVFAPTDEAFAKLPAGTLESLLADTDALTNILLYHVAEGKLTAKNVADRGFITTLLGRPLAITSMRDSVKVNDANVVTADIETSNGIIHVIDVVLVPEGN